MDGLKKEEIEVVCMTCGRVIREVEFPKATSHGICKECEEADEEMDDPNA